MKLPSLHLLVCFCLGLAGTGCVGTIEWPGEDGAVDAVDAGADPGFDGTVGDDGADVCSDTAAGDDGSSDAGADLPPDPCAGVDCGPHGQCTPNGEQPACTCDADYHPEGLTCVEDPKPCNGVTCSGHGVCQMDGQDRPYCVCDDGFHEEGLFCVNDNDPCADQECSGHGTCLVQSDGAVCACNEGYTPSTRDGLDCVPTEQVCVGGEIDYDYDNDGQNDSWFEPNEWECWQYELVNLTRATHDDEGSPECHKPLSWNVKWSAHGRNHSHQMKEQGGLFHADFPWGQNCAHGCNPPCEMNLYMTGANETHCPELSHHCNIMRCSFSHIGIGYVDTWNTQNFY